MANKNLTRRGLMAACALFSAFTLAACGGGQPQAENVLRRGIAVNPNTIDPHKAQGRWENDVIGDLFVGLYTEDVDAKPVYGMAESHTVSEDGLTWTFTLREAKWSDGVPVTAADFEFAFRRILNPATIAQYASLLYVIKNAEKVNKGELPPEAVGVTAVDARTLRIELEYPAAYLPGLLKHYTAYPVPKHVIETLGEDWTKPGNLVGNGPYRLLEWRTNDFLRAEANPHFWDVEKLCFEEVVYYPYSDHDVVLRMISRGQLDMNADFPGHKKADLQTQFPGWVKTSPALTTTYYVFNQTQPPFNDVRVRNALGMSLDREFITDEVLKVGYIPAYAFVPPGMNAYPGGPKVRWAELSRADRLAEAKRLLEEAGFGPNNPLRFTYSHRASGDNPIAAPIVQQNWREIADWVQPEIQQIDTQVLYANLRAQNFEVSDAGWIADYNDAQNFLYLLETRSGAMNYGKYSNPQFDALIDQSNRESDPERRAGLLLQAEQMMLDEMPIIPMWVMVNKYLIDPTLTGITPNLEQINRSQFICRAQAG
jgi:oligopeptide transport system substrate-binding protein